MSDAERLVNLALHLAASARPVTAEECRNAGLGYPAAQSDVAFIRMFERDKDALRAAGLVIDVSSDGGTDAYRLDAEATYARPVDLTSEEMAAISAVAAALSDDPGFPFGADLAIALGKLAVERGEAALATTQSADGMAGQQGQDARALAEAVRTRKTVTFDYTNAAGQQRRRTVEPWGVFSREGVWYFIGRDRDADDVRTFKIGRVTALGVNTASPRTPDFERPEGFDVREHELLPFQFGSHPTTARILFEPDVAWRADTLAGGRGTLKRLPDGSAEWTVEAADMERLATWIVEEGPGLRAVGPDALLSLLERELTRVVAAHE